MSTQRLDKLLSSQLNLSRSEARTAVRRGTVNVNGVFVRDPSTAVNIDTDIVTFSGQTITYKKYIYLLMNKPAGVLSASNDAKRETVIDLVPEALRRPGLFPVGRLDRDTTGLLLITDDGTFAHNIISPKKKIDKTYIAEVDGPVDDSMTDAFRKGVTLADGTKCRPAFLESLGQNIARIVIREGKYHQIKRMFGTVGLGVIHLHREAIGGLTIPGDIKAGNCVELCTQQLDLLWTVSSYTF